MFDAHYHHIIHELEKVMSSLSDLDAAIAKLQTDVNTLLAAAPKPVDTSAQIAAVNAIDAQIVAATPAA